ncbi:MAG: glycoside hydrolase family 130 protein [Acidimicrobiales bacterium]|jgi:predicted GH43/DUF377 family glycosyl hydrolase
MNADSSLLARRSPVHIAADKSRVVTRLFVPGQEGFDHQASRASAVLQRVLALEDDEVRRSLDDVLARFSGRHHDLTDTFLRHADELADRLDSECRLSPARRLLLGATFTSEYALEGAALCNPSMVLHPDQTMVSPGSVRFLMSVRAIGEGHSSSIGFREGTITGAGDIYFDPAPTFATTGQQDTVILEADTFKVELSRLGGEGDDANHVLHHLGQRFTAEDLETRLRLLEEHIATRMQVSRTVRLLRGIAERSYGIRFESRTPLSERVLLPATTTELQGMEDARFVRFTEDDAVVTYYASYAAYDGKDVSQQLLETTDFLDFTSSPIVGAAAANKGLALFPRRIDGRYAALCRCDRESNTVAYSESPRRWEEALPCQAPTTSWEVVQLGNCGPPIETDAGWLVLTHGVGPMRTYNIGAILLDLEDPTRVVGQLREPLLSPAHDEQDGYVPNVVYSCGALLHAGTLVLPYGIGDAAIGVATVPLDELLASFSPPLFK